MIAAVKVFAAALVVVLAGLSAACTGGEEGVEPVASKQCSALVYEGQGEPDVIVVSDFPRRGVGAETSQLTVDAIKSVLEKRGFRAGDLRVGFQSCNDTVGEQPFDESLCRRNARAYVDTEDVVGIVGPWNSGCANVQIPIVSTRAAGPLAMISPTNTWEGLTRLRSSKVDPDRVRSYARVVALNPAQGAAAARLAVDLGARRAALLHQVPPDDYAGPWAPSFLASARLLGLETTRFPWSRTSDYASLAKSVAEARPDVVFLAGQTQDRADQLVTQLRAVLPPSVQLIGPDTFAASSIAKGLGAAGEGMLVTTTSVPTELLPPAGQEFVRAFGDSVEEPAFGGAPEAAQATEVLLDAIGRSDGTRASVVEELFATKVENGILGSFTFDRFGDMNPAPIGVYRIEKGELVPYGVVHPPAATGP
jgi:branched-chain amino acid transport system substrate-binding protein